MDRGIYRIRFESRSFDSPNQSQWERKTFSKPNDLTRPTRRRLGQVQVGAERKRQTVSKPQKPKTAKNRYDINLDSPNQQRRKNRRVLSYKRPCIRRLLERGA